MKRVLLLGPHLNLKGGVTNYLELLIPNLENQGIHVRYFAHGKSVRNWQNIFLPLIILIQFIKLKKLLYEYKPNIVHINPSLDFGAIVRDFLFLKILKANKNNILLFIHGWQYSISSRFKKNGFWKYYFKNNFNRADLIVVLADQFKEMLIELGVNKDKIFVSTTMVDAEKYYTKNKMFNRPFRILFCANIKKEKGPFEIIEAAPIIIKQFNDTKFTFIGDGKDLEKLKKIAFETNINKNVEFTGYISQKDKIRRFRESHIFVFPTQHGEGFPTVILEAMASGTPIVTTSIAGLINAIKDGREGYIIESIPPNPKEISQKIIQLFENPKLMKKISEYNSKRAISEYDTKVIGRQIAKLYDNILQIK